MTRARTNADNASLGVTLTGTETLSAKTLTAPRISSPAQVTTVSATAAGSTVQYDAATTSVLYYTTNATGNWTLNIRGTAGQTLNNFMTTNDTLKVVFFATNGTTAYYMTSLTIDGNSITPQWNGGTAPTAGNASVVDEYIFYITKTAASTYIVKASGSINDATKSGTQTLINKTLAYPMESWYINASAFAGYTAYIQTNTAVHYLTGTSTGNGTLNITYASGVTLNSNMVVGQAITFALLITNTTAYYPNAIQVDGSAVTSKWSGGTAPAAGNASAVDAYQFTILKTANAVFTVLAAGPVKYA